MPNLNPPTQERPSEDLDAASAIAVVGYSFRLPDNACHEDAFWNLLENKTCTARKWPSDRRHPIDANFMGEDVGAFDAPFFSISAKEAAAMDPQQRIALEVCYRALENAGLPLEKLSGSETAVYASAMSSDYYLMTSKDPDTVPRYAATGTSSSVLAGRISWFFNFQGPSVWLDTACSGSLIALHHACQALRHGEASAALVVGSNVMLSPEFALMLERMNFLSPDSRCYSFDHRANGYARGEGVAAIVLKRAIDAAQDNDTVRAVIRSTSANHDGYTPGIAQPAVDSQIRLIRKTYERSGLGFSQTRYVEAHGTGTAVGDPIEIESLGNVFASSRSPSEPLYVGSVKSNIGHLESASGVAGLLKAIVMLERGMIVPNANFERLNPQVKADQFNIEIPTECIPWPSHGLRRASVNSFGFGGANAHAVIDDAYHFFLERKMKVNHRTVIDPPETASSATENGTLNGSSSRCNGSMVEPTSNGVFTEWRNSASPQLLVWSAADSKSLTRMVDAFADHCAAGLAHAPGTLSSMSYTLAERRSALRWRSFAVVENPEQLASLKSLAAPNRKVSNPQRLAFVFTGQGAQYAGMGLCLLQYQTFKKTLSEIDEIYTDLGCSWSITDALNDENKINTPQYSQPLCTAIQIGLIELLKTFGVIPAVVVGHSSGEIAAAYACGALSLESACKVAYFRGVAAEEMASNRQSPGAMLAASLSETEARILLEQLEIPASAAGVTVACINSNTNVTLSGVETMIDQVKQVLDERQIFAQKLKTGVAYHSLAMRKVASSYGASIWSLDPPEDEVGHEVIMVSSVTGNPVDWDDLLTAKYWVDNLTQPVKYHPALKFILSPPKSTEALFSTPINDLVEIGPHAALRRASGDIVKSLGKQNVHYIGTLSRLNKGPGSILEMAGHLFATGYAIDLSTVMGTSSNAYPFDHTERYWYEPPISRNSRLRTAHSALLGTPVADWNPMMPRWRKLLRTEEMPWLVDHVVAGTAIFPAAGMLLMACEAAQVHFQQPGRAVQGYFIDDASFSQPLPIQTESDGYTEVEISLTPVRKGSSKESTWANVQICMREDDGWIENGHIVIQLQLHPTHGVAQKQQEDRLEAEDLSRRYDETRGNSIRKVGSDIFYGFYEDGGLAFGPTFRLLREISWDGGDAAVGEVDLSSASVPESISIHPTWLDAALQMLWMGPSKGASQPTRTEVPARIRGAWIAASGWKTPESQVIRILLNSKEKTAMKGFECNGFALAEDGSLLWSVSKMESAPIADYRPNTDRRLCFDIQWRPALELSSADALRRYCETSVSQDSGDVRFFQDVQTVLSFYMIQAIDNLSQADVEAAAPHMQRYVSWMEHTVHGLRSSSASWLKRDIMGDEKMMRKMSEQIEQSSAQGRLIMTIGRQLLPIIRGEIDPQQTMFSDDVAKRYCSESFEAFWCPKMIPYLELLAHQRPGQRILEVGAGREALVSRVLPAFQRLEAEYGGMAFSSYDYATAPNGFQDTVQEWYGNPRINISSIDLDADVTQQGLVAESYDLIVADNVLHVTSNPGETLQRLKSLLKPNGKLIILEIDQTNQMWIPACFGILPGWWPGEHHCFQPGYSFPLSLADIDAFHGSRPTMSAGERRDLVMSHGFSELELDLPIHEDTWVDGGNMIVCTTSSIDANDQEEDNLADETITIVIDPDSALQQQLARKFNAICFPEKPRSTIRVIPRSQLKLIKTSTSDLILFLAEMHRPLLEDLSETQFLQLQNILCNAPRLLWVTRTQAISHDYPSCGVSQGLLRVLRAEHPSKQIMSLSFEDSHSEKNAQRYGQYIAKVLSYCQDSTRMDTDVEFLVRDDQIMTGRVVEAPLMDDEIHSRITPRLRTESWSAGPPLKLANTDGSLETLRFVEDPDYAKPLGPREIEIETRVWGLSFRDVLVALGRVSPSNVFGVECAGVVTRAGAQCSLMVGDRVCATKIGCMRMLTRCDERLAAPIPKSLSFEDSTSLIALAAMAYHSLVNVARLHQGESVLIHSASGGTGQLMVQIAQIQGAEIFATAGSDAKKALLVDRYGLRGDHIFHSHDTNFVQSIQRITHGRGVDVLVNSLAGESLIASCECMAPFGRFLEIGKADINANTGLPMALLERNVSFCVVDLFHLTDSRPDMFERILSPVLDLVAKGQIRPVHPIHSFPLSKIEEAFRLMQSGNSSGKIVISIDSQEVVPKLLRKNSAYGFDPQATYVIAGGLGGIGRGIARWMASKGAKNLILLSRSGDAHPTAKALVEELKSQGIRIETPPCDTSSHGSLKAALHDLRSMPPIKGCINAAMVLNDVLFDRMKFEQWNATMRSKVKSTWNLDDVLPPDMDFFILLSSLSGAMGLVGQANYAAGNTFQDAFARHRSSLGKKTIALDLGHVKGVGVAAEANDRAMELMISIANIGEEQIHALLDHVCNPSTLGVSQILFGVIRDVEVQAKSASTVSGLQRPLFSYISQTNVDQSTTRTRSNDVDQTARYVHARSEEERRRVVLEALSQKVARSLSIPSDALDFAKPLLQYGMDSLSAVELRNWMVNTFAADVAAADILRAGSSLEVLATQILEKSKLKPSEQGSAHGSK